MTAASASAAAGLATPVVIVGGGLAGGLLALALAERGRAVTLVDGGPGERATDLSYGVLQPGGDRAWRQLQQRHGDLGLRSLPVRLQPGRAWPLPWRTWLPPLPLARVDRTVLAQALPALLARLGVACRTGVVPEPPQRCGEHWRLSLVGQSPLLAEQVVLAAGAGCRSLWPALPSALRVSWAGVLELNSLPAELQTGRILPRDGALLPATFARIALERHAAQLAGEQWVVDGGLVPSGQGWLAGQISLVRPEPGAGEAPEFAPMERYLRQSLAADPAAWRRALAAQPGRYRQVPVSFATDGMPLAGAVAEARGLWVCAGFSGAFSQVPALVEALALQILRS